ncbi:helix-turn-helix domain-containing protein [Nonomuraea sp. NPDC049758]|uniref:TetR/AcrR family transcriptional regulator n=1 Tax=Nonomuraea sp. NPDC049758 TaxID=3154360 RepID=UPI00343419B7
MTRPRPGVRAAKAAQARSRMLTAARELFTERGYTATSMRAIAGRAGVAVQTLYFTFETKRSILKELLDVEVAGDDAPLATLERPWVAEALAAPPSDLLRKLAEANAGIHERVAPAADRPQRAARRRRGAGRPGAGELRPARPAPRGERVGVGRLGGRSTDRHVACPRK